VEYPKGYREHRHPHVPGKRDFRIPRRESTGIEAVTRNEQSVMIPRYRIRGLPKIR
jgi:hypothetical protein